MQYYLLPSFVVCQSLVKWLHSISTMHWRKKELWVKALDGWKFGYAWIKDWCLKWNLLFIGHKLLSVTATAIAANNQLSKQSTIWTNVSIQDCKRVDNYQNNISILKPVWLFWFFLRKTQNCSNSIKSLGKAVPLTWLIFLMKPPISGNVPYNWDGARAGLFIP